MCQYLSPYYSGVVFHTHRNGHLNCFQFGVIIFQNKTSMKGLIKYLFVRMFSFLLGKYLEVKFRSHRIGV